MMKKIKIFFKNPFVVFLYLRLMPLYFSKRFKKGYFLINRKRFIFSDPLSFVFMFFDIFIKKSYEFKSKSETPVIIDCGSNIGLSVLYFKKIYPNSIIKAFEPDKEIFKILEKNCENFKMKNVTLLNDEMVASNIMELVGPTVNVLNAFNKYMIPSVTISASIDYLFSIISDKLPMNLIQAQRDYFGAHTYKRIDKEGTFHTKWSDK